jgi:glycosyltransferase involved in cell wall biosynthesis
MSTPLPLVSCVMPTAGRPEMVARALRYFLRQDYPRKELLIAYDHPGDLPPGLTDPRIVLVPGVPGASIGAKRNAAVSHAAGALIAQWDDDDWYAPQRLSAQLAPILAGTADITGLSGTLFLSSSEGQCWQASADLFARLFVENIHGGTLAYRRSVWEHQARYPDRSLREDADFLQAAMSEGARLSRLPGRELFVYVRHGDNSWQFQVGRYLDAAHWRAVPAPACLGADGALYGLAPAARPLQPHAGAVAAPRSDAVLVSCIMPTAQRRAYAARAIAHFLGQDYQHKELIIVDDGEDAVQDLIPAGAPIRYLRLEQRASVGAKRNLACAMAKGSIIAHWDDDDWMAPGWLTSQVATLLGGKADLCGLEKVLFHAPERQQAWKYVYDGARPWVYGGTLCYTKAFWERNRFPDINIGEDNVFVWSRCPKRIVCNPHLRLYVATVHSGNTSPKQTSDRRWHPFPAQQIGRIQQSPDGTEHLHTGQAS